MKIKFCDKYILLVSKIDKNITFCLLLIGYEKVFGNRGEKSLYKSSFFKHNKSIKKECK